MRLPTPDPSDLNNRASQHSGRPPRGHFVMFDLYHRGIQEGLQTGVDHQRYVGQIRLSGKMLLSGTVIPKENTRMGEFEKVVYFCFNM